MFLIETGIETARRLGQVAIRPYLVEFNLELIRATRIRSNGSRRKRSEQ